MTKTGIHKASVGLLVAGLVISVLAFLASILGLTIYSALYFGAILAFLIFVAVIYLTVLITMGLLFGFINYIILFVEAFFAALANSSKPMDFNGVWPEDMDWNIIPAEYWEMFGMGSGIGATLLPLFIIAVISSLFAMIFAIVALANVAKGKSKGGIITGGVFAIISSLLGKLSIIELVGGVLAFFAKVKKKDETEEKPKEIEQK